jgi:hypothetical protein
MFSVFSVSLWFQILGRRFVCGAGLGAAHAGSQRAATYIVISNPRRMSTACGVCHVMEGLLSGCAPPVGGAAGCIDPASHDALQRVGRVAVRP